MIESIPSTYIADVFMAYRVPFSGLRMNDLNELLNDLIETRRTAKLLLELMSSDRHPYTVMIIASKVGMYVPPKHRVGLAAYRFFRDNIRYYEATFNRGSEPAPTLQTIYNSRDRLRYLMKFRDEEIVKKGSHFSHHYSDRSDMLKAFIRDNVTVHGEFRLEGNSRHTYTTKAKLISYSDANRHLEYSVKELTVELSNDRTSWHPASLAQLRRLILEKMDQWRHRDGFGQVNGPACLYDLLNAIEAKLSPDGTTLQRSEYLGNPIITL